MSFSSADITHKPIDIIAVLENKELPKEEKLQRALSILQQQPELLNEIYEKERKEQKPIHTTLLVNAIYQVQSNENEEQRNTYAEFFFRVLDNQQCLSCVDLNLVDSKKNTLLHLAARYARKKEEPQVGKEEGILTKMAIKLLQTGAKTHLINENGNTALTANPWLLEHVKPRDFLEDLKRNKPDIVAQLNRIMPQRLKDAVIQPTQPTSEVKQTLTPTPALIPLPAASAVAAVSPSVVLAPVTSTASIGSGLGLQAMLSKQKQLMADAKASFETDVVYAQVKRAVSKPGVSTRVVDLKQQALDAIKAEAKSKDTSKLGKFGCFQFRPDGMRDILKLKGKKDDFEKLSKIISKKLSKNSKRRNEETRNKYQEWDQMCKAAMGNP